MRRPGTRLHAWAARVFDSTAMTQVIAPIIADWQLEWFREASRGRPWRARFVWLRGYVVFAFSAAVLIGTAGVRAWVDDRPERGALLRMLATAAITAALVIVALETAFLRRSPYLTQLDLVDLAIFALLLIPSSLTIAIPIGLLVGQLSSSDLAPSSWRTSAALLAAALVISVALLANTEWLTPAANEAFRAKNFSVVVNGSESPLTRRQRGVNEMRLSELYRGDAVELRASPDRAEMAFHVRLALACAPLWFILGGLRLGHVRRIARVPVGVACSILYVMYVNALTKGYPIDPLPALLAAWLPNLLLAASFFTRRRAY